ncbi:Basic-leucine zipper domain [Dillenia turbinata]|uniref:Basic-leucine zipper domain n=1 Tax=Dillenia turbinata TaxID=194707 RepID=A0AAN8ZII2_9MAGN
MWSSSGGNKKDTNNNRVSCSPSKSSSTCSSPSSFSPSSPIPSNKKSMEEVWKDITLSSLADQPTPTNDLHNPTATNHHTGLRGLILQDFFSRSLNKGPHNFISPSAAMDGVPASPAPATMLSLTPGPDFHFLDTGSDFATPSPQLQSRGSTGAASFMSSLSNNFDALPSPPAFASINSKKRGSENDDNSSDRRHKRMIKNRESAARSRARKQAYTNELELEIAHLMEENARLRRQQEKLCFAATSQLPKKNTLQRSLTAPF